MRLLMLGGTGFVGRCAVEEAVARGWEVTAFHRGNRPTPAGARVLRGDRTAPGGLEALREGEWDAVVDTWSAAPYAVRDTAELLAGRVGRCAYVSSRSVYVFPAPAGSDESAPVVEGDPDAGSTDYAADKRGGELAAVRAFGEERTLLVRAGLILGPHEDVGRLPWWLNRMARGGDVLAPGPGTLPLQYVDARDLAAWTLDALAKDLHGPYDIVSPSGHTTMGDLLAACRTVTGSDAELHWLSPRLIAETGIEPWTELPVWLPPGEMHDAMHRSDVGRAVADGLRCRPVEDTVRDTWEWLRGIGGTAPQRPDRTAKGLSAEREAEALRQVTGGGAAGASS